MWPFHEVVVVFSANSRDSSRNTNMNHEKTVEELIYELGNRAVVLIWHQLVQPFHVIQENYDLLKTRALKLGVKLPDLTENTLSGQFLDDQITKVREYISLHKTESMSQLYEVGYAAEQFFRSLAMVKEVKQQTEAPRKFLQELIQRAKDLGVDIGYQLEEELKDICENYMNFKFHQDYDIISVRLKKKVCGGLRSEVSNSPPQQESSSPLHKRSEVDPTRVITDECWTVSLVRLPDRSNSEHAFIVLEGKTGRKSKIWFADFVAEHWFDTVKPGTEEGKVRMESYESKAVADPTSSRILFKCQKKMMDVRASDRLLFSTWLIAKSAAENLIRMIEAKQEKPPKYHILGDNSVLAGSSARSSSNPTGHNCFTFAKMMLRDLNDPFIELPEAGLETWIASATSRYLVDKHLPSRRWYSAPSFLLMFGFLAGIVVAYFLFKTFQPKK